MSILILGIESSCDDTSAAVLKDEYLLSNHGQYVLSMLPTLSMA